MEKIWYDPHEKSPRVDRILSQMSNLQTFELTQRVKAILQDKKKISPIPDIWRLRKQKNQSFFPEINFLKKDERAAMFIWYTRAGMAEFLADIG